MHEHEYPEASASRVRDAFDNYLRHEKPLLTAVQEKTATLQELAAHNLRLVVKAVRRHHARFPRQDVDSLLSVGNEALVTAACKFRPARGYRFATYAYTCIRLRLQDLGEAEHNMIKVPTRTVGSRLAENVRQRRMQQFESGRAIVKGLVHSDFETHRDEHTGDIESREFVQILLARLPERARRVLEAKYGMCADGYGVGATINDMSHMLGVCKPYVHSLLRSALASARWVAADLDRGQA